MSIVVEGGSRVMRIALDRPGKVNALTAEMMFALADAIREAGSRKETELVVLEGRGQKGFCGGADIAEFASGKEALRRQGEALVALTAAMSEAPIPTLSLLHGRTLGAGAMIAALSDLAIASSDLVIGCPEIRFGMYPAMVHAALIEKISPAQAWTLCASGKLLSAAEAEAWNLVTEILPAAQFPVLANARVEFYAERASALLLGRRTAASMRGAAAERAARSLPAMLENFALPGVTDAVRGHLGSGRHGNG
ncbi:MAG: enoyl-CoA hydratase/isomerase family protein [Rhodospirillales bacterium]|nr:enoyl-CoA hydratase/isomerase family protein [Rhodospirillales bacterium]